MGGSCQTDVQAEAACAAGGGHGACAVGGWTGGACLAAAGAVLGAVVAEAAPVAAEQLLKQLPARSSNLFVPLHVC